MKSANEIRQLAKNIHVEPDRTVDRRILALAEAALAKSTKTRSEAVGSGRFTWRRIMTGKTAKLSAAAVIVIAAIIGIYQSGGALDLSTSAWAKMLETMKEMPWVHVTVEIDAGQRSGFQNFWMCFDPSIEASRDIDGTLSYQDYDNGTMYVYEPNGRTITIYTTTNKYDLTKPTSPFAIIPTIIESMHEKDVRISLEEAELEGKKVEIIHAVTDIQEVSMVRDIERNLLMSMQIKAALPPGDTVMTANAMLEYPEQGPKDIYELGAPQETKVIDRRPKGDLADVMGQVQARFDKGFGDHIAMVLKSRVDENGKLESCEITMMRKLGALQRLDTYCAGDIERFENLYEKVKDSWPDLGIQQVEEFEDEDAMMRQIVFDGEYTTIRLRDSREKVITNRHKGNVGFVGHGNTINWIVWVDFGILNLGRTRHQKTLELLAADEPHEGLVGVWIYEPERETLVNMNNERSLLVGPTTDEYWFDPTRDYLLMDHTHQEEKGPDYTNSKSRTLTLEIKQTKSGQWYPSHIRHEWSYTLPERGEYEVTEDSRIIIDTEPAFPEGIFDPNFTFGNK